MFGQEHQAAPQTPAPGTTGEPSTPAGDAGFQFQGPEPAPPPGQVPPTEEVGAGARPTEEDSKAIIAKLQGQIGVMEQSLQEHTTYREGMKRYEPFLDALAGVAGDKEGAAKSTAELLTEPPPEIEALMMSESPKDRLKGFTQLMNMSVSNAMQAKDSEASRVTAEARELEGKRAASFHVMANDPKSPHLKPIAEWAIDSIGNIQGLKEVDPARYQRDWAFTEHINPEAYHLQMSAMLLGLTMLQEGNMNQLQALMKLSEGAGAANAETAGKGVSAGMGASAGKKAGEGTGDTKIAEIADDIRALRGGLGEEYTD